MKYSFVLLHPRPLAFGGGNVKLYSNAFEENQRRSYSTAASRGPNAKVSPKKVYPNADTNKVIILTENRNKAGIYRWVNLKNGKSYIGSALDLKKDFFAIII